jgi:hypothetical protein
MSERENEQDSGTDKDDDTESHRTRFHGQEEAPEDPNLAREGEPQKDEQDDDTESHRTRFHKPGE